MRKEQIIKITRRLIVLVVISMAGFSVFLSFTYGHYNQENSAGAITKIFTIPWIAFTCFFCGFIGGFVSIQQRIRKVAQHELDLLSSSWIQLILVPLFGGIFALILYILFLSKIVSGSLFPAFVIPPGTGSASIASSFIDFFSNTYPENPHEYGKLFFWCWVAGFSERFVPQLIQDVVSDEEESRAVADAKTRSKKK
ncbi:MAG TPA: hypothetical protein VF857_04760 [Spirochaetota bacterium]